MQGIAECSRTLLEIINDILDLSKLEAGKIELHKEPVRIAHLMQSVYQIFAEKVRAKGLELTWRMADSVPEYLNLDRVRFKQIVINLLSNAVKFTEQGSIEIDLVYHSHLDPELLICEISDSGIGMTREEAEKVFDEFEQGDSSLTREYQGTGLGLPIAKKLAKVMGGDIKVRSQKGRGSQFQFHLPCSRVEHIISKAPQQKLPLPVNSSRNVEVLLAEDFHLNRTIFRRMLHKYTWTHVSTVVNGVDAVKHAEKRFYDLIFLDIQMPLMDGFEACRRIRKLYSDKSKKPWIVALTAQQITDNSREYEEAGFAAIISKPFTTEKVEEVFTHYLWSHTADSRLSRAPSTNPDAVGESALLDTNIIDEHIESGYTQFEKLIHAADESLSKSLEYLDRGLEEKDPKLAEQGAHAAKGICLSIGYLRCSEHFEKIIAATKSLEWSQSRNLLEQSLQDLKHSKRDIRQYHADWDKKSHKAS